MTGTADTRNLAAFALRTHDAKWITRNNGTLDEAGRVVVMIPAGEIEAVQNGPAPMLRHVFRDRPKDFPDGTVMCPAMWVPETAARFAGQFAPDASRGDDARRVIAAILAGQEG
jgi:hypothetical protein